MPLNLARLWVFHATLFIVIKSWLAQDGGLDALIDSSKRKPNVKNRVDGVIEKAVLDYAINQPAHRQHRTSNEYASRVSSCLAASLALSGLMSDNNLLSLGANCFSDYCCNTTTVASKSMKLETMHK